MTDRSDSNLERRKFKRVSFLHEIEYEGSGVKVQRRLVDLSVDGIYIDTTSPLPEGSSIRIKFSLPGGHIVEVDGVVCYCQPSVGMGIEFTNLSPQDRAVIEEFVKKLS